MIVIGRHHRSSDGSMSLSPRPSVLFSSRTQVVDFKASERQKDPGATKQTPGSGVLTLGQMEDGINKITVSYIHDRELACCEWGRPPQRRVGDPLGTEATRCEAPRSRCVPLPSRLRGLGEAS